MASERVPQPADAGASAGPTGGSGVVLGRKLRPRDRPERDGTEVLDVAASGTMSSVPVFERLVVEEYGLYPGTPRRPGLDITFDNGLTLVLGANGLGKTTLVTMLYRICTGPAELRASSGGTDFGGRAPEVTEFSPGARRAFAERVVDGARDATATLTMRVGPVRIEVSRRLTDLELIELSVDERQVAPRESAYRETIATAAGVPTFGDWILLLRYLVFYFEDRRALVWDPTAQRQLIRLLFFSVERAADWAAREREVQSLDSQMRNLQSVLTRQESKLARQEASSKSAPAVREELEALSDLQDVDEPRLEAVNDRILMLDAERHRARLAALTADQAHESAFRNLERLQLSVIDAAFPSGGETAKYILAQLISDGECLACGNSASNAANEMRNRATIEECVVCGTALGADAPAPASKRALTRAQRMLTAAAEQLSAANRVRAAAEEAHARQRESVHQLNTAVAERRARIDELLQQLPPDESAIHQQRDELAALRGQVEAMRYQLTALREDFSSFIARATDEVARRAEAVKHAFDNYAAGFLMESVGLVWSPNKDTVGQAGPQVSYPAFELTMGSASFPSPVRRSGPNQVSESQREFIDLAFRMTLMTVATGDQAGSLVIDAPESSLDAVFVRRAADVLSRFAQANNSNRLVITSNLIEGDLVPHLLRTAGIRSSRDHRVVDLLRVAAPTVATTELHDEYVAVRKSVFQRAGRL